MFTGSHRLLSGRGAGHRAGQSGVEKLFIDNCEHCVSSGRREAGTRDGAGMDRGRIDNSRSCNYTSCRWRVETPALITSESVVRTPRNISPIDQPENI